MSADVIIPVYRPDKSFYKLLLMLLKQSVKPKHIFIILTETKDCLMDELNEKVELLVKNHKIMGEETIELVIKKIKPKEFDHGGTRHMAAGMADADYLLFFTQDAIPVNEHVIEELIKPFEDGQVAVVYGRQLAKEDATDIEIYTRIFNYPAKSKKKTKEDKAILGIKTYFCSNVCAAYRRSIYKELGGFHGDMIFNEDMLFAAGAIRHDYAVYYNADAKVYHSHDYTWMEQFKRNFDLGVSQRQHREVFDSVPSEKEGIKLAKQAISFFIDRRDYASAIDFIFQSIFKYAGYFLGKHYNMLPKDLILLCTMNRGYWKCERREEFLRYESTVPKKF